ncbi:unnamed protein product, partial [marine sediment metagenome]
LISLLLISGLISSNALAQVPPDGSHVPAGQVTVGIKMYAQTSGRFEIFPPVAGVRDIIRCDKVIYYNPLPPVEYYDEPDCRFLIFIPDTGYEPGTTYTVHAYQGKGDTWHDTWTFTTDNPSTIEHEKEFVFGTFVVRKPQVAVNSFQIALLNQDPYTGITLTIMRHGSIYREINIASNYYYNINAAHDIAMNKHGVISVAIESDYREQCTNLIKTHHYVFDKDGNQIMHDWLNHSFSYEMLVLWYCCNQHQMMMSKGGPSTDISDNGLISMGTVKIGCPTYCEGYLS